MQSKPLHIRFLIVFVFITAGTVSYSQDSTLNSITVDTMPYFSGSFAYQPRFNYIYHSSDPGDDSIYENNHSLINQLPIPGNYDTYYTLAGALWNLGKTAEAEKMFLIIINSKAHFYCQTYYHSSDIPGDTTVSTYGYGSYSSNYKNGAATYLAKIYIEQNKFAKALKYTDATVKKYKAEYTCGTGFRAQKDEYDFLYARSYEGLRKYNKILNILLPGCLDRDDSIILRVLKKKYTPAAIKNELSRAEHSIVCFFDPWPSMGFTSVSDSNNNFIKYDTVIYHSGYATIKLFGRLVNVSAPELKNGEYVTKEHFIQAFKNSGIYSSLADMAGLAINKENKTGDSN